MARSGQNVTVHAQGELGYQHANNSSTRYHNEHNNVSGARVVARKLISDGSHLNHDIASREANARAALFSYLDTAHNLIYETAESYVTVLKTMELVQLAIENVEIHTRLARSIRARVEAKTSGKSELERVQGRLAAAQATLVVRQNDYKRSVYNFHKIMGRFIDGLELETPVVSGALLPTSLSMAFETLWKKHPLLISTDYNLKSRERELMREETQKRPTLFIEASQDWRKNMGGIEGEDKDASVLLRLSVPMFDGNVKRHRAKQYTSLVHREKHVQDNVLRTLLNDLQLTYSGYRLLDSQIGMVRKNIFFTKQALRSYQQEFKLGKRLLINILDAEVEYQNAKAQLAALQADLLISKYRVLLGTGDIAEAMGVEVPYGKEVAEGRRARVATIDEMPMLADLDGDGIEDRFDVSMNSLREQVVNELGETAEMTKTYLEEPVRLSMVTAIRAIKDRADLQLQSIQPDVPTELGFVTFATGSVELSLNAKVLMREILPQLKRLADEGMIKIAVTHGDSRAGVDAHLLATQRAYNIKKILTMHMFEADGIIVEARPAEGEEHDNAMILTVQTDSASFIDNHQVLSNPGLRFSEECSTVCNVLQTQIEEVAKVLKTKPNAIVDIVVYSNDQKDPIKAKSVSLNRASKIKDELAKLGVCCDSINTVGWGDYDEDLDLYNAMDADSKQNRVEIIIKE